MGTPKRLPKGVGTVTLRNGEPQFDEFGFLIRIGVANPPREVAADDYPQFELAPGERRPTPGECYDGVPVFCWVDGAYVARPFNLTTRTIRGYTTSGIPCRRRGDRDAWEFPIPHATVWVSEYQRAVARVGVVGRLDFSIAWARHRLWVAEDAAR